MFTVTTPTADGDAAVSASPLSAGHAPNYRQVLRPRGLGQSSPRLFMDMRTRNERLAQRDAYMQKLISDMKKSQEEEKCSSANSPPRVEYKPPPRAIYAPPPRSSRPQSAGRCVGSGRTYVGSCPGKPAPLRFGASALVTTEALTHPDPLEASEAAWPPFASSGLQARPSRPRSAYPYFSRASVRVAHEKI
ncbi:hypothetical protein FOL47_009141 [Perkinsus chesapeaki]|uniref:Uncharacterized protein n=1 Tax=Perkinsus chesapeaki TaxID=330153 RepID=A0A7J6LA71_PERCH|nr:hypothetical protein FOL47_009141 [Perkinsus chesapeaki]